MSAPKMFRKDELAGKTVIESSGKSLGKAKDVAFGLDGSIALIVAANDGSETQIGMDRVAGVAEYIVVMREQDVGPSTVRKAQSAGPASIPSPQNPPQSGSNPGIPAPVSVTAGSAVCRNCGAPLRAGAKFCTRCGTPV